MSCCTGGLVSDPRDSREEILLASRPIGNGERQVELSVPSIHCGGCIHAIERALNALPDVSYARVNLSAKRVAVRWRSEAEPPAFIETLDRLGYPAHLFDFGADAKDPALGELIRALAVSGFAASNIMLLSVSIWSGADAATRDAFHWVSALIAGPALLYSGQVFFRSAWRGLRHGQTNMDVPISIGVLLAFGMSAYETLHRQPHAYFDASITLVFFLLIGRTLDHLMRERARTAIRGLARLAARGALVANDDGNRNYLPIEEIRPGMTILLAAGERVPVDAVVVSGQSDVDCAIVSGESLPQTAIEGSRLQSGVLNLTGPLTIVATAAAKDSFLAEITRMVEAAETGRSAYRRIADRTAKLYAPAVHLTALLTFFGWMIVAGDVHRALTIAIAVLIITCPCALGLAVPMVQVVAARRLFERGIMLRDGSALERLAEIDAVIFDKTGTLTFDRLQLAATDAIPAGTLAIAASIASRSTHPYSRALFAAARQAKMDLVTFDRVTEQAGAGLEARTADAVYRLGRADWALDGSAHHAPVSSTVLSENGKLRAVFQFDSELRPDVNEAIRALKDLGISIKLVSGDRDEPVRKLATLLDVPCLAGASPKQKIEQIAAMSAEGHRTLMVGDGLNDTPALAAAQVSMAPASAADVGRNAADLVFLRDSLLSVPYAITTARSASRLVRQNLALAIGYNAVAVPVAVSGHATPLIAAVAMSVSSIIVIANALRLGRTGRPGKVLSRKPAPELRQPALAEESVR